MSQTGCSFIAYIDEAGDEGFKFKEHPGGPGSSSWFVLSALVVRAQRDAELISIGRELRSTLGWKANREFHFRKMAHDHRVVVVQRLRKCPVHAINVLLYKPLIQQPERFQQGTRLYFYAVRLLLERISWLCRDKYDGKGDKSAKLIFSNRATVSYSELCKYLQRLKALSRTQSISIEWDVIRPQLVAPRQSKSVVGLQLADVVAGSFFKGLEPTGFDIVEDRYARELRTVVYKRGGQHLGYGVKLWPQEAAGWITKQRMLQWFGNAYPR